MVRIDEKKIEHAVGIMNALGRLLTVGEIAELLSISTSTIKAWVLKGRLPSQVTENGWHWIDPRDVPAAAARDDRVKLSPEAKETMRELCRNGLTYQELSERFAVSPHTVYMTCRGIRAAYPLRET